MQANKPKCTKFHPEHGRCFNPAVKRFVDRTQQAVGFRCAKHADDVRHGCEVFDFTEMELAR